MNKHKNIQPIQIEIGLTDIITPKSCSMFVAELIKFIVFNKQQIPYPYERLKMFVMKRIHHQKMVELSNSQRELSTSYSVTFLMEKHYKKVEEAYRILDSTFKSGTFVAPWRSQGRKFHFSRNKNQLFSPATDHSSLICCQPWKLPDENCIEHELMKSAEQTIEEIVLLFGATPMSPRDVYRIKIPSLYFGHCESQHVWKKQISNLFKGIIISDEVNTNIQKKVGLTNMFVLMKVKKCGDVGSQWLLPKDQYRLSNRSQQVCFSFTSSCSKPCSCSSFELHRLTQNMTVLSISDDFMACNEMSDFVWYQTAKTLKGFKDSKSKGKSIADLWFKHGFL